MRVIQRERERERERDEERERERGGGEREKEKEKERENQWGDLMSSARLILVGVWPREGRKGLGREESEEGRE